MAIVENKRPIHYVVDVLKYLFLILFALVTLLPFLNLVAKGLSGESAVISGRVLFWPMNPTLKTYQYVLKGNSFFNAFKVSVFLTVFGSVAAVIVTAMTAYPLSRSNLRGEYTQEHYGAWNVHKRLLLRYGEGYGLRYSLNPSDGVDVRVRLKA